MQDANCHSRPKLLTLWNGLSSICRDLRSGWMLKTSLFCSPNLNIGERRMSRSTFLYYSMRTRANWRMVLYLSWAGWPSMALSHNSVASRASHWTYGTWKAIVPRDEAVKPCNWIATWIISRNNPSSTIQILFKEELVKPYEAERTIKQKRNLHLTVYSMEVVMLLAFRLNSYQARAVRRELTECISRDHKPFEVVMTAVKGGKK